MDGPVDEPRADGAPAGLEPASAGAFAAPVSPIGTPADAGMAAVSASAEHKAVIAARIAGQTLVLIVAEFVATAMFAGMGLQPGNAGHESIGELTERGPLMLFAVAVLLLPFVEELIFRLVPSKLCDWLGGARRSAMWSVGVVTAALFAAMHNLTGNPGELALQLDADTWFSLEFLPISQFLAGLFLWHLMRKHGLLASFGAHAFHNFVLLSLALAAGSAAG